jgi:hypothetical protein
VCARLACVVVRHSEGARRARVVVRAAYFATRGTRDVHWIPISYYYYLCLHFSTRDKGGHSVLNEIPVRFFFHNSVNKNQIP